jgi:hypothetical protein
MYCDPPAPGKHQEKCRHYEDPTDDLLNRFEDVLQKAADRTGLDIDASEIMDMDISEVMDEVRKKNARSGKMESTGEA